MDPKSNSKCPYRRQRGGDIGTEEAMEDEAELE
jgi:hypothetical protein